MSKTDQLEKFLINGGRLVIQPGDGKYEGRAVVSIESDKGTAAKFPLDNNGTTVARLRSAINSMLDTVVSTTALQLNLTAQP